MSKNGYEFWGNIVAIREIEDCIRVTKKYTEGVRMIRADHPVQGEDFPSKKFCKVYDVFPEMEISADMGLGDAIDLLWGDTPCVPVVFNYDYRDDKASVSIDNKTGMLEMLLLGIPRLCELLEPEMTTNGYKAQVAQIIAQAQNRMRDKEIADQLANMASLPEPSKRRLGPLERLAEFLAPHGKR